MITIYRAYQDKVFLPFNLIGEVIEDCRERAFWLDLMRLLALWVVIVIIPIVQVLIIMGLLSWPVNLYG
jgi:hypothetical protein